MEVAIGYKTEDKEIDAQAAEYFDNLESLGFDRANEILEKSGFYVEIIDKDLYELHYIRRKQ